MPFYQVVQALPNKLASESTVYSVHFELVHFYVKEKFLIVISAA